MNDDQEIDILGTKAVGKAIEMSIKGIGSFLSKICMPAAEEFGLLLRDKVASFRLQNLEKITQKADSKILNHSIPISGQTSPRIIKEIVEEASWESDDAIQDMWAGLIAGSVGGGSESDDSLIYIDTLKKLTPFQARLINGIYSDPRCCSVRPPIDFNLERIFHPENQIVFSAPIILNFYPGKLDDIVPIAHVTAKEILNNPQHHGIAIGRFMPQIDGLVKHKLISEAILYKDKTEMVRFLPNATGLDFYMRCLGYNIYPIEAFLLTLQVWCQQKDIDPFTYTRET